jgi:hypothetical protein
MGKKEKKKNQSWVPMANIYNPCYLGDWDQENWSSRPGRANSFWDLLSKLTRVKWTGGVEHLLCKSEALSSNPLHTHTHTQASRKVGHHSACRYSLSDTWCQENSSCANVNFWGDLFAWG